MGRGTGKVITGAILFIVMVCCVGVNAGVLLEAESILGRGGWVVDQQHMDLMGSPYLLAHGMGRKVTSAITIVDFGQTGTFHVWVRTRDWWAPNGPGMFQVVVSGTPLDTVFGKGGTGEWEWKYGGTVNITSASTDVMLQDSTGFEGRCDAIYFSTTNTPPPSDPAALAAWRKSQLGLPDNPPVEGTYDLVVVGGGIAGCCAAISAARLGLTVALIQNRPVLGGNNSSEVRVGLTGEYKLSPWPNIGNIVREISARVGNNNTAASYRDDTRLAVVQAEPNISLFLNTHVMDVVKSGNAITGVIGKHIETGVEQQFNGSYFCDATGDASVGFLAGADYRSHRESQTETSEADAPNVAAGSDSTGMGFSNMWRAEDRGTPSTFPNTSSWALNITSQCITDGAGGSRHIDRPASEWYWESGFARNKIYEAEYIRDHNFRAIYGVWDCLKNDPAFSSKYANYELDYVCHISGKRESRRLMGDIILTQTDIQTPTPYSDGLVGLSWGLDLHYPASPNTAHVGPGNEFLSYEVRPGIPSYEIPYRCLYSRNVDNLFMAGRNISVTHIALGSVRVMSTTGMMGEVVGTAAYVAKQNSVMPRGVYQNHLDELKSMFTNTNTGGAIVVDNVDATTVGSWSTSTYEPGFFGDNYLHDGNDGKGSKTVTYTPTLPSTRTYSVYILYNSSVSRATNVPVTINHAGGNETVSVNMQSGGGEWQLLGSYTFNSGSSGNVVISNTGTSGHVIADAIKWDTTGTTHIGVPGASLRSRGTGMSLTAGKSTIRFNTSFVPDKVTLIDPLGRRLAAVSIAEGQNHIHFSWLKTISGAVYFAVFENGDRRESVRFFWK